MAKKTTEQLKLSKEILRNIKAAFKEIGRSTRRLQRVENDYKYCGDNSEVEIHDWWYDKPLRDCHRSWTITVSPNLSVELHEGSWGTSVEEKAILTPIIEKFKTQK